MFLQVWNLGVAWWRVLRWRQGQAGAMLLGVHCQRLLNQHSWVWMALPAALMHFKGQASAPTGVYIERLQYCVRLRKVVRAFVLGVLVARYFPLARFWNCCWKLIFCEVMMVSGYVSEAKPSHLRVPTALGQPTIDSSCVNIVCSFPLSFFLWPGFEIVVWVDMMYEHVGAFVIVVK